MANFRVIIPARYDSRRLPGKVLRDIAGKPMLQRVVECARASGAAAVTVATDDRRILRAAQKFGGEVILTGECACGTDRVAAAAAQLGLDDAEIIVNVQADEPEMPAALIKQVAQLATREDVDIATAAAPLESHAQWTDAAAVKVIIDARGLAIYFSRAPLPHSDRKSGDKNSAADDLIAHRHIGIYAYRYGYLKKFAARPQCDLERAEKLEQLRALHYGDKIACANAVAIPPPGVDTAVDLQHARARYELKP